MGSACRTHGRDEKCIHNIRGSLIGPWNKRENNIKINIKEIVYGLDSFDLV
jgi:hypothetical protein